MASGQQMKPLIAATATPSTPKVDTLFGDLLTPAAIATTFETQIAQSSLRGIDRTAADSFRSNLGPESAVIHAKCSRGSYRFTPYLESLRSKGREKCPRVLATPTIRDRIVLYTAKEVLHTAFPECVPRRLPNQYIRDIVVSGSKSSAASIVKADIKSFYDEIRHDRLLTILKSRLPSRILRLVERAIRNPTVTLADHRRGSRRLLPLSKGVPQGLSISNILAEIYVREIDENMKARVLDYFRYVDDILMFTTPATEEDTYRLLSTVLADVGLALNEEKRFIAQAGSPFDYLGYRLTLPHVSVKQANLARLLDSLAAYFARWRHKVHPCFRRDWLDAAARQKIFLEDLNERITGAVSERRRYGWLFHFIEITDVGLLYNIDHIVRNIWRRVFGEAAPPELKRFSRAYHEAQFNQLGRYIHNYDRYDTLAAKLDFLVTRGHLDPKSRAQYTHDQVDQMFRAARHRSLLRLEADVGIIS